MVGVAGSHVQSYKLAELGSTPRPSTMFYTKTQWHSFPTDRNCEMVTCEFCPNETAVLINDFVTKYVCPVCYSVPKLSERKVA